MRAIEVTSLQEMGKILDYVHDRFFQLDDIQFDQQEGILLIPLTVITDVPIRQRNLILFSIWQNPIVKADLIIHHVKNYSLNDEAKVGEACINTISFENDFVIIISSVPVELRALVSGKRIELKVSDTVVGAISRFGFGSPPGVVGA